MAQLDGGGNVCRVGVHEHHVCRANGNVGTGANGNAHVGAGKRRGVVDAVTHHSHLVALALQLTDLLLLLAWKHAGHDLVDAHLTCHGLGGLGLVAREHDGAHAHAT